MTHAYDPTPPAPIRTSAESPEALAAASITIPAPTLTIPNTDDRERISRARVHLDSWAAHLSGGKEAGK